MTAKISSSPAGTLVIDQATTRKTARPEKQTFSSVMGQAAGVALHGVEIGATVLGGPLVGAAVRTGTAVIGSSAGSSSGPLDASLSSEQSTMNEVRAMQEQSQMFNLQYLNLQEEVQQENRRFTTISNVLKAKHETAKAAVSNIRS